MSGPIAEHFHQDHRRLEDLLNRSVAEPGRIDDTAFQAFRRGILKHIAWEEKILIPALRRLRGGEAPEFFRRLRIDHGAIASLLVPTPTPEIVEEIRSILGPHNELEEGSGGLYETCGQLPADEIEKVMERVRAYPEVKTNPYYDGPGALRRAEDALRLAARAFERRERKQTP